MIYPIQDKTIIHIYECGVCGKIYVKPNRLRARCLVFHAPGSCCHYGEQQQSAELVKEIMLMANAQPG